MEETVVVGMPGAIWNQGSGSKQDFGLTSLDFWCGRSKLTNHIIHLKITIFFGLWVAPGTPHYLTINKCYLVLPVPICAQIYNF